MTSPLLERRLLRNWWLSLSDDERAAWIGQADEPSLALLAQAWEVRARDSQYPPDGDWRAWLICAGRGFGKTRTGAETVRIWAEDDPKARIALVGRTAADVRDVMVEGESGILAVCPEKQRPVYEPSKRRLTWPNGAIATTYSADEPNLLRGPQHTKAWVDELAAWRYPDAWDQLQLGLRLGSNPQVIVTTTPRPTKIIRELLKAPTTHVTRGSTYENKANLAPAFLEAIIRKYEGTTMGRQELYAEVLDEMPGALWTRALLDGCRVSQAPQLTRIVVAIDPAATATSESDETGIVVAAMGLDKHCYVLADLSGRYSPDKWGGIAVREYRQRQADRIVYETNQGGDMVAHTLRTVDPNAALKGVRASRGKAARAEPVAALYEQRRVHHVGVFAELEDQLCNWAPGAGDSPDRLDALVWAVSELMLGAHVDSVPAPVEDLAWDTTWT